MIQAFTQKDDGLAPLARDASLSRAAWVDLVAPDEDERASAEAYFGAALPRREEIEEIELSSRLYHENGAHFVTMMLPVRTRTEDAMIAPVCFALNGDRIVTLRFHEPKSITAYAERAARTSTGCGSPDAILMGMIEEIIDRIADLLEWIGGDLDKISARLFRRGGGAEIKGEVLQDLLSEIGLKGGLVGDLRTSLLTIERGIGFLAPIFEQRNVAHGVRTAIEVQRHDVNSLSQHADALEQKISLLLNATLGAISIEQNGNIKLFSVIAVVFLPPTLIASIYGMNFHHMPELDWPWAYPLALLAMVVSAVLPITWFRHRGWL